MPTLTTDELKAKIAAGEIGAFTIDTVVFDAKQKTFRNAVLRKLDQFHGRGIDVVIADVVANEMKAHLAADAADTQRELNKALRKHTIRWARTAGANEAADLKLDADPAQLAASEFDEFLSLVHGEVLKAADVINAVEQVLDRYFAAKPPFGASEKRKSEFPDALALLRLEAYAAEAGNLMLCVSADNGWIEFAEQSEHLVCVSKLDDALALFHEADEVNKGIARAIVGRWREAEIGPYLDEVANAFEARLDYTDFWVDADADVPFEGEGLSASLQFVDPQTVGDPTVIAADVDTVTFTVEVEARVSFEASFNFFVVDSVDKDYTDLGTEEASTEKTLTFKLTITADRSLDDGLDFHEVEVARTPFEVHFGYVEAFPNEDPTHEKY